MAQYRCQVKPRLSRSQGASVARAAAYIEREKLEDARTGETYDFSGHKDKALWTGVYAPKGAPDWAHDPQKLCIEIERAEKRKDSQLALPVELSLAHELTLEQNRWMMQDFIKENFTRPGYATMAAIHEPPHGGDPRNIHAHLLVTLRTIDENGFSKTKTEQQENYMARVERVEALRASWEKHLKHHLERHGFEKEAAEVSCKSLKEQGIDREPQQHLGPTAAQMEREGKKTERGDLNREVQGRNRQREQLTAAEKEVSQAIAEAQRKLDAEVKQRSGFAEASPDKQADIDRRAQEWRDRNAAAAETIRGAWTSAPRDVIAFMINLNDRGLYVAQDQRGGYAAVEPNGYAHRLPDKDMQEAIDALRRENSGLVIPTVEEQRTEQREQRAQQREQLENERDREEQRRMAHDGATLYNRASMPSMQRDALIHIRDAHRQQEIARRQQEREQKRQERVRGTKDPPRDQAAQKRADKQDRTEQTSHQQSRARRDEIREELGLRKQGGSERGDEGGRERERER